MDNTIDVITHNQCTGCGACYNKCPVNAIVMKPDAEGFFFPVKNPSALQQDILPEAAVFHL